MAEYIVDTTDGILDARTTGEVIRCRDCADCITGDTWPYECARHLCTTWPATARGRGEGTANADGQGQDQAREDARPRTGGQAKNRGCGGAPECHEGRAQARGGDVRRDAKPH